MAESMIRLKELVRKGPSLKLTFFVATFSAKEYFTEEYIVADLAKVRFRFKCISMRKYEIYFSNMKNLSSEKSIIGINVTCDHLNYSKHFNCSHDWSDWILLGTEDAFTMRYEWSRVSTEICSDVIIISVRVSKEDYETYPKLYGNMEFTDFQLTAPDGSVAVHKACLAARSDYFKKAFSGKWVETEKGSLSFKDLSRKNLEDLKDFIYLGTLPDDGLLPLIALGKRLLIEDLVAACTKKLAETVLPENYYSLHEHACTYNMPELSSAITELTSDKVVHDAYLLKMKKDTAPETGEDK